MKKVMILSAAALMLSLAMPQFSEAATIQNENTIMQVKEVQYQEIAVKDIPQAVSATIAKDFAGNTTDKLFMGDDGTFKVIVSKEKVKQILTFDNKGLLLKTEKPAPAK